MPAEGAVIIYNLCPINTFSTSNEVHTFWANSQQSLLLGHPAALSTRLVFLLCKYTTVCNLTGARERTPGHRVPWCQPDPPYPGVPRGGSPNCGGHSKSSSSPAWVLTSQPCHLALSHPTRLAGATDGLCLSWHCFPGYPQIMRDPSPWQRLYSTFAGKG